ncbi:hypothetical protein ACLOJK_003670 [Asimina triloba]
MMVTKVPHSVKLLLEACELCKRGKVVLIDEVGVEVTNRPRIRGRTVMLASRNLGLRGNGIASLMSRHEEIFLASPSLQIFLDQVGRAMILLMDLGAIVVEATLETGWAATMEAALEITQVVTVELTLGIDWAGTVEAALAIGQVEVIVVEEVLEIGQATVAIEETLEIGSSDGGESNLEDRSSNSGGGNSHGDRSGSSGGGKSLRDESGSNSGRSLQRRSIAFYNQENG